MYKGKKIVHIVAVGLCFEIGYKNNLLFKCNADMQWFKRNTVGNVVLMGRKTVESLPKPLQNRVVLEVSDSKGLSLQGQLDKAVEVSDMLNTDVIFVAGGGELYRATNDIVDYSYITMIDQIVDNCDTWYDLPQSLQNKEIISTIAEIKANGCAMWKYFK